MGRDGLRPNQLEGGGRSLLRALGQSCISAIKEKRNSPALSRRSCTFWVLLAQPKPFRGVGESGLSSCLCHRGLATSSKSVSTFAKASQSLLGGFQPMAKYKGKKILNHCSGTSSRGHFARISNPTPDQTSLLGEWAFWQKPVGHSEKQSALPLGMVNSSRL